MDTTINTNIQAFFNSQTEILTTIEDFLAAWNWTANRTCQLPLLLNHLKEKYGWDKKTLNGKDPVIRDYLRNHTIYTISRGAHGGIELLASKQKKNATSEAKKQAISEEKIKLSAALDKEIEARANISAANDNAEDLSFDDDNL
jgi:hypothetical protein